MNESSTNTDQPFRPTNLLILILLSSLRAANKQTKKVLEVVSKSDEASSLVALLAVAVGAVAPMPVTDGLEVGAVVTEEKGTKQRICITSRRKDSSANSWLWRKFRYLRVMKSGVVVVAVAIGAPVFGLGANSSRHHGDELSAEVGKQLFANDVKTILGGTDVMAAVVATGAHASGHQRRQLSQSVSPEYNGGHFSPTHCLP
ncbi:unnamed protein product [Peronospora belbahrii]|uniref:Uncharacterized protein n=1 Tax=Peronospora belbahrii TaxID=622444 RepID=A0ABN8D960_9STRA|nr:unnamed protein product [Peronospora belbahrii]